MKISLRSSSSSFFPSVLLTEAFLYQDAQTVGAYNLLGNLISHANVISRTLFKCVIFEENNAVKPKHRPLRFQLRILGRGQRHLISHTLPTNYPLAPQWGRQHSVPAATAPAATSVWAY